LSYFGYFLTVWKLSKFLDFDGSLEGYLSWASCIFCGNFKQLTDATDRKRIVNATLQ